MASVAKSSSFLLVKLLNFVEARAGDSKLSFLEKSFNTLQFSSSSFAMTYQKQKENQGLKKDNVAKSNQRNVFTHVQKNKYTGSRLQRAI